MKKFKFDSITYDSYVTWNNIIVEAENKDDAIEQLLTGEWLSYDEDPEIDSVDTIDHTDPVEYEGED